MRNVRRLKAMTGTASAIIRPCMARLTVAARKETSALSPAIRLTPPSVTRANPALTAGE
jgi:hypothetical protein